MKLKRIISALLSAAIAVTSLSCGSVTASAAEGTRTAKIDHIVDNDTGDSNAKTLVNDHDIKIAVSGIEKPGSADITKVTFIAMDGNAAVYRNLPTDCFCLGDDLVNIRFEKGLYKDSVTDKTRLPAGEYTVGLCDEQGGKLTLYKIDGVTVSDGSKKTNSAQNGSSAPGGDPQTPAGLSAVPYGDKTLLMWEQAENAQGYIVYRSTKKKSGYKKLVTVKKGERESTTVSKLKAGKTYYLKIRSYAKINGKTVYSKYSKAVKYTVPKKTTAKTADVLLIYSYYNVAWEFQQDLKIFGADGRVYTLKNRDEEAEIDLNGDDWYSAVSGEAISGWGKSSYTDELIDLISGLDKRMPVYKKAEYKMYDIGYDDYGFQNVYAVYEDKDGSVQKVKLAMYGDGGAYLLDCPEVRYIINLLLEQKLFSFDGYAFGPDDQVYELNK